MSWKYLQRRRSVLRRFLQRRRYRGIRVTKASSSAFLEFSKGVISRGSRGIEGISSSFPSLTRLSIDTREARRKRWPSEPSGDVILMIAITFLDFGSSSGDRKRCDDVRMRKSSTSEAKRSALRYGRRRFPFDSPLRKRHFGSSKDREPRRGRPSEGTRSVDP